MNVEKTCKTLMMKYGEANMTMLDAVTFKDPLTAVIAAVKARTIAETLVMLTGDQQFQTLADYQRDIIQQHLDMADNAKLFGILQ